MELSKNFKIGLGSLVAAMVLSLFAPIVALRSAHTATAAPIVAEAPAPNINNDGSAGIAAEGWLTWWGWGYWSVTYPHYGQTYQNPTRYGIHRTLVVKSAKYGVSDAQAYVRLHISHANENSTGCLLIQDSVHTWIHLAVCDFRKWAVTAAVISVVAIGAGWLGWLIGQLGRVVPLWAI